MAENEGKLTASTIEGTALTSDAKSIPQSDSSVPSDDPAATSPSDSLPRGKSGKSTSPWSKLFQDNRNLAHGLKLQQYGPEKVVQLTKEDVLDTRKIWKATLIGYVVGKPTDARDIDTLRGAWNISFQYMKHPSGWMIFKFDTEEQKQSILANGPYSSSGFPWIMKDIPPFFSFGDESFSFIPVWITLPGLPMECWSDSALGKITSQVGKPITTDRCTALQFRVSFARVLVEIDARKELVRNVPIKMPNGDLHDQSVLFEFEPKLCATCNRVGHPTDNCRSRKIVRRNGKAEVDLNSRQNKQTYATVALGQVKEGGDLSLRKVDHVSGPVAIKSNKRPAEAKEVGDLSLRKVDHASGPVAVKLNKHLALDQADPSSSGTGTLHQILPSKKTIEKLAEGEHLKVGDLSSRKVDLASRPVAVKSNKPLATNFIKPTQVESTVVIPEAESTKHAEGNSGRQVAHSEGASRLSSTPSLGISTAAQSVECSTTASAIVKEVSKAPNQFLPLTVVDEILEAASQPESSTARDVQRIEYLELQEATDEKQMDLYLKRQTESTKKKKKGKK